MKVVTLVGTRPELIKLSCVIAELEKRLDHVLVHSGQNYDYELNEVFFNQLGLPEPRHFLGMAAETAAEAVAKAIAAFDKVLRTERPDAMLILGDTNSCMAAYAAKRLKIPIFHMEAGNRCFDQRVPEEINRALIDHMSDINMPYTEHARSYLLREGISPETVIKTGSPMREVLERFAADIEASSVLAETGLEPGGYFVLSCHREENVDDEKNLERLFECVQRLDAEYALPVLFSVHPRTRVRLEALGGKLPDSVLQRKPFGFFEYIKLQKNAYCVLSDSGTLTEESALLDFPAVMLRQAHERPEGMDVGSVVMADLDPETLLTAVRVVASQREPGRERQFQVPPDYRADDVSRKVVRTILSYTGYVNRTVWKRFD